MRRFSLRSLSAAVLSVGLVLGYSLPATAATDPQPLNDANARYVTADMAISEQLASDVQSLRTFGRATYHRETDTGIKYSYLNDADRALDHLRNASFENRNVLVDAFNQYGTTERRDAFMATFAAGLTAREQMILAERIKIEAYVPAVCSPNAPREVCPNPYPNQTPQQAATLVVTPTAMPTATPVPSMTPSPSVTPMPTSTPEPTVIPTPFATPMPTPVATSTPMPTPVVTPMSATPSASVQAAIETYKAATYQRRYSYGMTLRYLSLVYSYNVMNGTTPEQADAIYLDGLRQIPGMFAPQAYDARNQLIDAYNQAGMLAERDALIAAVEAEVQEYRTVAAQ